MPPLTYTIAQLQAALQETSEERARQRIALLEQRHGFPRKLPGFTLRWSKPAVDRWFEAWGAATTDPASAGVIDLRQTLEKAYGS